MQRRYNEDGEEGEKEEKHNNSNPSNHNHSNQERQGVNNNNNNNKEHTSKQPKTKDKNRIPTVLLTLPPSKAADMVHLCVPKNQALGVCRGFVPDIQVCGTHGREDLVDATITSNAEEEEEKTKSTNKQKEIVTTVTSV